MQMLYYCFIILLCLVVQVLVVGSCQSGISWIEKKAQSWNDQPNPTLARCIHRVPGVLASGAKAHQVPRDQPWQLHRMDRVGKPGRWMDNDLWAEDLWQWKPCDKCLFSFAESLNGGTSVWLFLSLIIEPRYLWFKALLFEVFLNLPKKERHVRGQDDGRLRCRSWGWQGGGKIWRQLRTSLLPSPPRILVLRCHWGIWGPWLPGPDSGMWRSCTGMFASPRAVLGIGNDGPTLLLAQGTAGGVHQDADEVWRINLLQPWVGCCVRLCHDGKGGEKTQESIRSQDSAQATQEAQEQEERRGRVARRFGFRFRDWGEVSRTLDDGIPLADLNWLTHTPY